MNSPEDKRPSLRDAARRGPAPASSPPRRPGDKPFIPFVRFEDIVARCGHAEKFGILPDAKDRFREDRRKKAMSRDCKACREKRAQLELEAAEVRRIEKEKRKQSGEQQAGKQKSPRAQPGRLPDGSRFEVSYEAAKEQWSGSLMVTTEEGSAVFTGSGSGLFPLLSSLDRQYRATIREEAPAGEEEASP